MDSRSVIELSPNISNNHSGFPCNMTLCFKSKYVSSDIFPLTHFIFGKMPFAMETGT